MEVCDGVIIGGKEVDDVCEGGAVGGRGAGGLWFEMDVATVHGDDNVFVSQTGWHGIAAGQVRR